MSFNEFYTSAKFPKAFKAPKAAKPLTVKPAQKGPQGRERHQKKLAQARTKAQIREHVRELDGYHCRWPDCQTPQDSFWGAIDVAHYRAEGAGGDPLLSRYTPENLVCLCKFHHAGPRGLHSGLARMEPLDAELGMRGSVMCLRLETGESGKWLVVGITSPPTRNT